MSDILLSASEEPTISDELFEAQRDHLDDLTVEERTTWFEAAFKRANGFSQNGPSFIPVNEKELSSQITAIFEDLQSAIDETKAPLLIVREENEEGMSFAIQKPIARFSFKKGSEGTCLEVRSQDIALDHETVTDVPTSTAYRSRSGAEVSSVSSAVGKTLRQTLLREGQAGLPVVKTLDAHSPQSSSLPCAVSEKQEP